MALVSNSKYGPAVELAAASAPSTDVALYAKAAGDGENAHMVLKAHTASFTGDVHVTGTLHVEGTINSTNRNETNLIIEDKTITVASGSNAAATAEAGLHFGGSGDSPVASFKYKNIDPYGNAGSHLLASTGFKATGELHGTTISGSGPIKTADAMEAAGNVRSESDVIAEGNLSAVSGDLSVGSYGLTNAGALSVASLGSAVNCNSQALTNVNIDSGDIYAATISGGLTWSAAQNLNSQALTNVNIDSGLIDNAAIGQSTPAAGSFTQLSGSVVLAAAMKIDAGSTPTSGVVITGSLGVMGSGGEALMYDWSDDKLSIGAEMTSSNGALFSAGLNSTTLSASSNLQVGGTSDFDGAVTMDNTLAVAGAVTMDSTLDVAGNLSVGSYGLTSAGAATIASMAGNWTNAGRQVADMGTVLTMDLNGGTIDFVTIGGTIPAAGTFTALSARGDVDLGNATSDTISANGRFDTDLVPSSDSARDLGSSDLQWAELHVDAGYIDAITVSGQSSLAAVSASSNLQVGGTADFDGAVTMDNTLAVAGNFSVGSYGLTAAGAATIASMAGNWTNAGRTVADMGTVTTMDLNGGTIDGATIATSDITVGSGKTLNVSAGTLTTSAAQKKAIIEGAGSNLDVGAYNLRAQTLTADGQTQGRVAIYGANGLLSEDSDLSFSGDTLTATKIGAFEAAGAINFASQAMTNVNVDSGAIDGAAIGANSRSSVACTTLDANGNVVLGDASSDTITINGTVGNFTAGVITATELVATSDARLKSNIQGVTNAMDVINHLQGVEYDLNETGEHSMGVLAQELIEVAPALVKTRENGNYAVNYSGLSAFFVEAIKEQQAQIEDLKNTVEELSK